MPSQRLNAVELMLTDYVSYVLIYDHILCEKKLINSFKKALNLTPYLSGRIKGIESRNPIITGNDSGVLFVSEHYDQKINNTTPISAPHIKNSCINIGRQHFDEDTPVLQVKLSKYKNGSTLGLHFHHSVCDAVSFINFLKGWAAIARNEEPFTFLFNRNLLRRNAYGRGAHPSKSFPVKKLSGTWRLSKGRSHKSTFRLTSKFLTRLLKQAKAKGIQEEVGLKHSLWSAYIWKLMASACHDFSFDTTNLLLVYNTRKLLNLDKNYFGNAIAFPLLRESRDELRQKSIESIGEKIHSCYIDLINDPIQVRKDIAFWNKKIGYDEGLQHVYESLALMSEGKTISINNLSTQPIYDIDFGSGNPIWFEHIDLESGVRDVEAFPSPERNGDIILFISAPKPELLEISRHLNLISEPLD